MFAEMVEGLGRGELPDPAALRGRCHAGVTKKLAVITLPPTYWETDPKRNPDTMHLLWAVFLLHDEDLLEVMIGIILMEQAERDGLSAESFLQSSLDQLLLLAPDESFAGILREKTSWIHSSSLQSDSC